jgi:type I restriction enzyme S subunit
MKQAWPEVPLSEVARPISRSVSVVPGQDYRTLGVKWWGEGAYERETIDGTRTAAKTLSIVRQGDLIINKIWVRHGSTAIAGPDVDGCAASGEFPTFTLDKKRIIPQWMHWQTKMRSFWEKCAALSQGTSGKNRIRPDLFLTIRIPLPPLAEQRRVVARIEELAGEIEEAKRLRREAVVEAEALMGQAISAMLDNAGWTTVKLGKILADKPRNGLGPQQEVDSGGQFMLRINAVSSSPTRFVDMFATKRVELKDEAAKQFIVQNDDVFIVRYNGDINRVAKPAIYKGLNAEKIVYPDKLMRLHPDTNQMTPDFLVFALNARMVRNQIEELGKTTAGNIGVSGGNAQSFVVPVPPLPIQRRIVAELDALQAQVDELKKLQAESAAELDALLPSMLDRAFKGQG